MTGQEFVELATGFAGTIDVAHFDRRAFRCKRIFASLAPDEMTANLYLTPDEQQFFCEYNPDSFSPVASKWGARGWTTVNLQALAADDLRSALHHAWLNGGGIGPE